MKKEILTNSSEETQKLGEEFITGFNPDKAIIIALYGDLGAGKTTFVQGLAKGLGISKRIISPTFTIIRQYKIKDQRSKIKNTNQKSKTFIHVDLYRVQTEREIKGLGIGEILSDPQNLVVIEWAEKMGELLPKDRIDIYFEHFGEYERKITILDQISKSKNQNPD